MADENNSKLIDELSKKPGNDICADCGAKDPQWSSYNIGIFICVRCATIHRGMGTHISKVKHLKLDNWEDSQLERMREVGNINAKLKYEQRVPVCYRRPVEGDPQSLLEEWICAKYLREEFSRPGRHSFLSGNMEGFLMKRGKEDPHYHPRKFSLNEVDDTLKYYVKENKDPKAILKISELNVSFAPHKIHNCNSMQFSFMKDSVTRHIFVYHDDPQTIVTWYTAIRCAKLHRLQIAFPAAIEADLLDQLMHDFAKEGWLWKTGPKPSDSYKKRWFTLDGRKLMYHEDSMDAHPKGEIFLGHMLDGYSVRVGVPPCTKDQGFAFTLRTPQRWYYLSALSSEDRNAWIKNIDNVLEKQMTPQDYAIASKMSRKKSSSLFSMR